MLPLAKHNGIRYNEGVIVNFACNETEKIWNGQVSRRLPSDIQQIARRKLRMIHNAHAPEDLRQPPGNHLEKLRGEWEGFRSIRINAQWRICFRWENETAHDVQIVDYH
jgi:proteic killer suppression protein